MQTTRFVTKPNPITSRILLLVGFLVGLVPVLVFWVSVQGDFVRWDDDRYVTGNPQLQADVGESLAWAWTDVSRSGSYMPLTWTGWILNHQVDGLAPATYHLGNVLFHGANAVLVFALLLQLLRAFPEQKPMTTRRLIWLYVSAGLASLLWALHPLRVEPVAWVSGRVFCQALFFLLISLNCYMAYQTNPPDMKPNPWLFRISVAAFAASLLTYPLGLGAVIIFVLIDYFPLRHLGSRKLARVDAGVVWREKIPFIALAVLALGVTLTAGIFAPQGGRPAPSLEAFGWGERIMQAFYIWAYYLWRNWWPLELSPMYANLVSVEPQALKFWGSMSLVILVSVFVWLTRRRWQGLGVLWVCYLALLAPWLGLMDHPHQPKDHYSYLIGITWTVLIGALLWSGFETLANRRIAFVTCLFLTGAFGLNSFRQCMVWKNTETLLQHAIVTLEDSPIRSDVFHRLGDYFLEQGRFGEAEYCFREELDIKPDLPRGLLSLGNSLVLQERWGVAIETYARLLEVRPQHRQAALNLGLTLMEGGRPQEAVEHFDGALQHWLHDSEIALTAAKAARQSGNFDLALDYYKKAMEWTPESEEDVSVLMANTLLEAVRPLDARILLEKALLRKGDSIPLAMELAWLLSTHPDPSIRDAKRALELARRAHGLAGERHGRALDVLAAAYANSQQFQEAARLAQVASEVTETESDLSDIQVRLQLYRQGKPVRSGGGGQP